MAALIESKDGRIWSVASWVFDNIMRLTHKHVPEDFSKLRSLMHEEENPLRHIQLGDLSLSERAALTRALEMAYREAEEAGSQSFDSPEFYSGFMDRFRELIELITEDG